MRSGRVPKTTEQIVTELLKKAILTETGCFISHLKPNKKGYVPVQSGGRTGRKWRAHRLVYHFRVETITDEDLILHSCDKRNCINPLHLRKGTPAENTADMMEKARGANQYLSGYNWKRGPRPKSFYSRNE